MIASTLCWVVVSANLVAELISIETCYSQLGTSHDDFLTDLRLATPQEVAAFRAERVRPH